MYVATKGDVAQAWSKERLNESVKATPVLRGIFNDNRRGSGNTILQKQFPGGQISIVSAQNPDDLAMRACRIMLFDECDKYPDNVGAGGDGGGEGDVISVAWGRATTYGKRAKKITACSPTVQGRSRIEKEFLAGNQCEYHMPCPNCNHFKVLEWPDVIIPCDEDTGEYLPQDAYILCSECGHKWDEGERKQSSLTGKWVAKRPQITHHHSYRVSSFASPFTPVEMLAKEFVKAMGDPQMLKAFYNTRMARTWREMGEQPDWERIYERRESYPIGIIPDGGLMLTMGVDVQKAGIYYEVVAWGRRKISWSVECGYMEGSIDEDEFREKLKEFFNRNWENSHGINMQCECIAVDSGYNTAAVYSLVRECADPRIIAVKGDNHGNMGSYIGTPKAVDINYDGKRITRGVMLWAVNSHIIKENFYRFLVLKKPTDEKIRAGGSHPSGFTHFPEYDEEFFKQITAETMVTKVNGKGFESSEWEKTRPDNHYLDCRVYATAAAYVLQFNRMDDKDWDKREKRFTCKVDSETVTEDTSVNPQPNKPKKKSRNKAVSGLWKGGNLWR